MHVSRRRLLRGAVASSAALVLAACGETQTVQLPELPSQRATEAPTSTGPAATQSTRAPSPADSAVPPRVAVNPVEARPQGPVPLTLGVASGNAFTAQTESMINAAVAQLRKDDPGLELRVVQLPIGPEIPPTTERWVAAVESALGEGQALDLVAVPAREVMINLAEQDIIQELGPHLAQGGNAERGTLYPLAAEAITRDGKIWAEPWGITPLVLWYVPELVEAAGVELPPEQGWDWEEFRDVTEKLTVPEAADGTPGQWGFYAGGATSLSLIWQNAGDLISDDGTESRIAEPAAVEAVQYVADLVYRSSSVPPFTDASPVPAGEGKLRIEVNHAPLATVFGQAALPGQTPLDTLGVRLAPMIHGRESVTLGSVNGMLGLMQGTGDAAAAFGVLQRLATSIGCASPFPVRQTDIDEIMQFSTIATEYEARAVLQGLETARGITHPKSDELLRVLIETVENPVVIERADPDIACAEAAEKIDEILNAPTS